MANHRRTGNGTPAAHQQEIESLRAQLAKETTRRQQAESELEKVLEMLFYVIRQSMVEKRGTPKSTGCGRATRDDGAGSKSPGISRARMAGS
jgi:hypothetical protein